MTAIMTSNVLIAATEFERCLTVPSETREPRALPPHRTDETHRTAPRRLLTTLGTPAVA